MPRSTAITFCVLALVACASVIVMTSARGADAPTVHESTVTLTERVHKLEQEAAFTKRANKSLRLYVKDMLNVCDCRITCVKILGDTYRGPGGILDNCLTECRVKSYQNAK